MQHVIVVSAALVLAATVSSAVPAQERAGANPHGQLLRGLDCSDCHTAAAWRPLKSPMSFDHAKATGFALTGSHASATCGQCHTGLRFDEPTSGAAGCADCHADVHQGRIAGDCARCHSTSSFKEVPAVALHARAGFPLSGAHLQAPCESCHRNDQKLADPAKLRVGTGQQAEMPDLGLSDREISALASYINHGQQQVGAAK